MTRTVAHPTRRQDEFQDPAAVAARRIPVVRMPLDTGARLAPTWRQADPERIAAALADATTRDPGNWYVLGAASDIGAGRSVVRQVAGREIVLWRAADGRLLAGPGACPHLGASLDDCPVDGGTLRCKWHGMPFTAAGSRRWPTVRAHDDGVLAWVQLDDGSATPSRSEPVLPTRPPLDRSVTAIITMRGRCEPSDVVANRLDPWHGSWLHPYAFSHLTVDEDHSSVDRLVVDVAFRLNRTWAVPVRAVFSCPDARTIVMEIVEGEGAGSVVETHATPIGMDEYGAPITQVTEATIAHSPRGGFRAAARLGALFRPAMRRTARRLWVDDLAYAERRYRVRAGEVG